MSGADERRMNSHAIVSWIRWPRSSRAIGSAQDSFPDFMTDGPSHLSFSNRSGHRSKIISRMSTRWIVVRVIHGNTANAWQNISIILGLRSPSAKSWSHFLTVDNASASALHTNSKLVVIVRAQTPVNMKNQLIGRCSIPLWNWCTVVHFETIVSVPMELKKRTFKRQIGEVEIVCAKYCLFWWDLSAGEVNRGYKLLDTPIYDKSEDNYLKSKWERNDSRFKMNKVHLNPNKQSVLTCRGHRGCSSRCGPEQIALPSA
jgi:hypothetical protein